MLLLLFTNYYHILRTIIVNRIDLAGDNAEDMDYCFALHTQKIQKNGVINWSACVKSEEEFLPFWRGNTGCPRDICKKNNGRDNGGLGG